MMVCPECGHKLLKREDLCPDCNTRIIYKCKCGKEFPSAKYLICPECKSRKFRRNKIIITLLIAFICGVLMLIPDPIIVIDEMLIGVIGLIITVINLVRKEKE